MTKTHKLKLTSATVVNGQPVAAGTIIDVDDAKARRLLDAGKADLATVEDVASAEGDEADSGDTDQDNDPAGKAGEETPAVRKPKGGAK